MTGPHQPKARTHGQTEQRGAAMSERLVHFSDRELTAILDKSQEANARKPTGLWVSVEGNEDGWSDWCRSEEFGLDRLSHEHEIFLTPHANILRLGSAAEIDRFTEQYGHNSLPELNINYRDRISWLTVAALYQGIIISPYIWPRRLTNHTFWYYGWDCASGCIWDSAAVERVTLVSERMASMTGPP